VEIQADIPDYCQSMRDFYDRGGQMQGTCRDEALIVMHKTLCTRPSHTSLIASQPRGRLMLDAHTRGPTCQGNWFVSFVISASPRIRETEGHERAELSFPCFGIAMMTAEITCALLCCVGRERIRTRSPPTLHFNQPSINPESSINHIVYFLLSLFIIVLLFIFIPVFRT
jgi:hypothetical protein